MRIRSLLTSLVVIALPVSLGGCGTRGELYTEPLSPLPLLVARDGLVSIVPGTDRAVFLPADGSTPRAWPISSGARAASVTLDQSRLLVLGGESKAPSLDLIELESGTTTTVPLFGPFDRFSFSEDGTRALLSYAAQSRVPGLAARNLNEVALVNLSDASVTRIQLDTESLAPKEVVFGPALPTSQYVAVTFDRGVAVFDALTPERSPRRISLRPPGSTANVSVAEALFTPDGQYLFVRADGVNDVVVIELGTDVTSGELTAALNFIAGGTGVSDIALPGDPSLPHGVLALFSGSGDAMLLDASGVEDLGARIELPTGMSHLQPIGQGRAFIYAPTQVSVVAWDVLTRRSGIAVLDGLSDQQLFSSSSGQAVFTHRGTGGTGPSISVVSVEEVANRLRPRVQSIQLTTLAGPSSLGTEGQAFVTSDASGVSTVVSIDLASLALGQVTLDGPTRRLLQVPAAGAIAVVHSETGTGDLTWIPTAQLDRSAARRVSGYNLTGDLDRSEAP